MFLNFIYKRIPLTMIIVRHTGFQTTDEKQGIGGIKTGIILQKILGF